MLSAVLKTEVAEKVSVAIMDAFVIMKKYISNSLLKQKYINNQVLKNTEIFYKGQIYDAYSLIVDILNSSHSNIIIIDNYVNKQILDICAKVNKNIIIITNKISKIDCQLC